MRLYQTQSLTFSEDDSSSPNKIIYQDNNRTVNDTSLPEGTSGYQAFNPSATDVAIPMGNIAAGKFLYLIPDAEISFKLDAGPAMTLAAGKACQMWVDFTSITVSNPSAVAAVNVSWTLGGD